MELRKGIVCILAFMSIVFVSCTNNSTKTIGINNKYRTEIRVHYSTYEVKTYTYYTNDITDICSFNGTNYLIEKDKTEELLSTTAPIEIVKQSKFDKNGTETECEQNYYRGSN